MKEAFRKHSLLWNSCVGVSMDNTAVDMDKRNSIVSALLRRLLQCTLWAVHGTSPTTRLLEQQLCLNQ